MTMSLLLEYFDDLLATSDNVVELNNAILQLAIQGKLVPQNSIDEPATELIKPIKDDIEPIDESEILFDIPENWLWIRLGDLGFTQTGSTPPTSNPEFYGNEYPFVRPADISDGFDLTVAYRHDDGLSKSGIENGRLIKPGSIMMVCIGSVGKVGFVDRECACNQQINVLIPSIKLNAKLLTAFMRSPYFQKEAVTRASKTTLPILNKSKWAAIPIPIPPLAEQERIIARVEELFAQTRALAKELAHSQSELDGLNKSALSHLLASETPEVFDQHWAFIAEHFDLLFQAPEHVAPLRQSILELAVRGKLTRREAGDESAKELLKRVRKDKKESGLPPIKDSEKSYELPIGWEWVRFGEIGDQRLGKMLDGSKNKGDYYPYLRNINVQWLRIDLSNINQMRYEPNEIDEYRLQPNDLLICEGGEPGRCAIWESNDLMMFQKAIHRVRPYNGIVSKYLLYHLWGDAGNGILAKYFTGATIKHFTGKALANYVCALPPVAEQERIVKRVEQLLSLCDGLEACLQSAEEERGRLVKSVMAGVGGQDGE